MMVRSIFLASLVAACGTDDPRPPTVEVIATEILAPTCGQVQCHSTTTMTSGYAFDTLATAKVALRQLTSGGGRFDRLISVITATGSSRMPPDSPLDDADIALIQTWVGSGARGL
jgi:hypothetical protein